ncbi:LytTR family DNA-binding domain-containing protein [Paraglaciecola sp.]|uniref:LytR/AlgR family response regulator transcription factor n=1 Tax=Paraglaciecola sp. TaxID=1920173 RepID=UPI0032644507
MYRCIVIDDESLARERIVSFVNAHPGWIVVASCGEYSQAQAMLIHHKPDLCFMDINLVGGSGVELVKSLNQVLTCHWVFSTAHYEFAIKAFELNVADYLLKPFEDSRLVETLMKVEKLKAGESGSRKSILAVKSVGTVEFINVQDIIWVKGAANYVELHCKHKMLLHRETLTNLAYLLDPSKFLRVHRSSIVNIDHIQSLSSELGRFSLLHLTNGDEVKIGQGHKGALFESLGIDNPEEKGALPSQYENQTLSDVLS